jgi:hypothetical protein
MNCHIKLYNKNNNTPINALSKTEIGFLTKLQLSNKIRFNPIVSPSPLTGFFFL